MSSSLPIGVFDSGVGGLSILEKIHSLHPQESIIYVADSAFAPYGPKGDDFIIKRSQQIMTFFKSHSVKAVVVACNTATAAAVAQIREESDFPIVGMEPALKPAALASTTGVIGVLATEGTLASDKFFDLKSRFEKQVEIINKPCPGLVEHIEQIVPDVDAIRSLLKIYIAPLLEKKVDTLVLGCTHYSFISNLIQEVAGQDVKIIDTDDAVARRLGDVLKGNALLTDQGEDDGESEMEGDIEDNTKGEKGRKGRKGRKGDIIFYSSGDLAVQEKLISKCWGARISLHAL